MNNAVLKMELCIEIFKIVFLVIRNLYNIGWTLKYKDKIVQSTEYDSVSSIQNYNMKKNQLFCYFVIFAVIKIQVEVEKIIKYIKDNGGYAKMHELRQAGFQTRDIKKLVDEGKIEKVKSGLYKIWNAVDSNILNPSFIDVCKASPKSVIALLSAVEYYELSTVNPPQVYAAIPKAEKPPKIKYPPVKFYYWEKSIYEHGITEVKTKSGIVKIYDREKTICDLFRYRDKLGEDIAFESLKNYLMLKDFDLRKLRDYAEKLRIKTILLPYIKVILG